MSCVVPCKTQVTVLLDGRQECLRFPVGASLESMADAVARDAKFHLAKDVRCKLQVLGQARGSVRVVDRAYSQGLLALLYARKKKPHESSSTDVRPPDDRRPPGESSLCVRPPQREEAAPREAAAAVHSETAKDARRPAEQVARRLHRDDADVACCSASSGLSNSRLVAKRRPLLMRAVIKAPPMPTPRLEAPHFD